MALGYTGKVLRVDLASGTVEIDQPSELTYRRFPGGSSLALHYLLTHMPAGTDPLAPESVIVFAAGILTGCPVPGLSRFTVAARSPETGAYGESEAGGFWGPELKFAGFDALVVRGAARAPVYLWIHDGVAELRDASRIWGMPTAETEDAIQEELGDQHVRVAAIGPAGERLVRYACIVNDHNHVNGRCGMGTVMGSKNLKAIAVRGSRRPAVKDRDALLDGARRAGSSWRAHPACLERYVLGTARGLVPLNMAGMLPTRNMRDGVFEGAADISGEKLRDEACAGAEGCYACPAKCKRVAKADPERGITARYGGPEYETIASLGSYCGVRDLAAIVRGHELCNGYGMDSISTGACIAFAMECYEHGLLTPDDTGGIELRFGNADAMLAMVEAIGERRGLGRLLGEGVLAAARRIGRGAENRAVHVKGQPLAMHDPRGKVGVGLAYAISPTGPDHMEICHDGLFQLEGPALDVVRPLGILEPVDALDLSDRKVRLVVYLQLLRQLDNILGICDFLGPVLGVLTTGDLVNLVRWTTGWDTSLWELLKASERTLTMARLFNVREGLSRKDDWLPERLFEPLPAGPLSGRSMDRQELDRAVRAYYEMMGWDSETGAPREAKLRELDLLPFGGHA